MTTNLFVIANVKQLRTGGSFRILLPLSRTFWGVSVLNSAIFSRFHNRVEFGTILEGLRNFGGGGLNPPPTHPPPRYATALRRLRFTSRHGVHIPQYFNLYCLTLSAQKYFAQKSPMCFNLLTEAPLFYLYNVGSFEQACVCV